MNAVFPKSRWLSRLSALGLLLLFTARAPLASAQQEESPDSTATTAPATPVAPPAPPMTPPAFPAMPPTTPAAAFGSVEMAKLLAVRTDAEIQNQLVRFRADEYAADAAHREARERLAVAKARVDVKKKEVSTIKARVQVAKKQKLEAERLEIEREQARGELEQRLLERLADAESADADRARAAREAAQAGVRACTAEIEAARLRAQRSGMSGQNAAADAIEKALRLDRDVRAAEVRWLDSLKEHASRRETVAGKDREHVDAKAKALEAWKALQGS